MSSLPEISVITATYNRSNVLRFAIESLVGQTFTDWELIVVGDACTDDTGAVVDSFGDPRIRFVNLTENFGEQSGPNNFGFEHARGRLITYLNHDDLYLPDHLATSRDYLSENDAPWVTAATLVCSPIDSNKPTPGEWQWFGIGVGKRGRWHPGLSQVVSSWMIRREVLDALGGWRPAARLYQAPSGDLAWRAFRAGYEIHTKPHFSLIHLSSMSRKNSYKDRQADEQRVILDRIRTDPAFVLQALESIAIDGTRLRQSPPGKSMRQARRRWHAARVLAKMGISPESVFGRLKYGKRGGFFDRLYRTRGLGEPSLKSSAPDGSNNKDVEAEHDDRIQGTANG